MDLSWAAPAPSVLTGSPSAITYHNGDPERNGQPKRLATHRLQFLYLTGAHGISTFPCVQQLAIGGTPVPVSATAAD